MAFLITNEAKYWKHAPQLGLHKMARLISQKRILSIRAFMKPWRRAASYKPTYPTPEETLKNII